MKWTGAVAIVDNAWLSADEYVKAKPQDTAERVMVLHAIEQKLGNAQ